MTQIIAYCVLKKYVCKWGLHQKFCLLMELNLPLFGVLGMAISPLGHPWNITVHDSATLICNQYGIVLVVNDILVGNEQGHLMSPELFKCYISDLSIELNEELKQMNVPMLNGNNISHLLHADDLVLLALDAECLQKLILKL